MFVFFNLLNCSIFILLSNLNFLLRFPPFDTPSEVGEVHFIQTPYLSGTFFPYRIVMEYSGFRDCGQVGENTKKFSFTATTLRQIQSAPTVEVLQRDWFKSSNEVFP